MANHDHNIRNITSRTANGRAVTSARIVEDAGYYCAIITDCNGAEYVSGSNNTDLIRERAVLRGMLDPEPARFRQERSRKARADAGGKQVAVMLTPAAAAKLAARVAKGDTIAAVINRMLTRART